MNLMQDVDSTYHFRSEVLAQHCVVGAVQLGRRMSPYKQPADCFSMKRMFHSASADLWHCALQQKSKDEHESLVLEVALYMS